MRFKNNLYEQLNEAAAGSATTRLQEGLHCVYFKKKKKKKNIALDDTIRKHKKVKEKLKDLERANDRNWKKVKDEIDKLYEDIDEELRKALTYYAG